MPNYKQYTYTSRLDQPVYARFCCEYCNHIFVEEGKLAASGIDISYNRTLTAVNAAKASRQAVDELLRARKLIEEHGSLQNVPQKFMDTGAKISYFGKQKCPKCGYVQQTSAKSKPRWTFKRVLKILFWILFSGLWGAAIYAGIASSFADGNISNLVWSIVAVVAVVFILIAVIRTKNPNAGFMRKHGLTKDTLPAPRKPEITFGEIVAR